MIQMNQVPSTGQCKKILGRVAQLFALVLFLVAAGTASAQLTTADIVGTVTDASGAIIPNASVTVVNLDTQQTRTTTSNATGDYLVTLLPVGRYSVTVKAKGFRNYSTPDLPVEAGDRARADAHMATGGDTETVTVEATTPLLQADNATVSSTVTAKAVQDLPLNGRNFVQLVQLVPGANEGPGNGLTSGGRPDDRRQTSGFSVNGQDNTLNDFTVDGIDDNERIIGAIGVRPDVEGIQEITVQTNSYAPEAGRTAGGVVSIITKSGTNKFHGSAYEFFRNDIFDARNVLQTTGRKPELRQNQFGGSFGGPIIKDRTFFFADYEGLRNVTGTTYTSNVPDQYEYNAINSLNGETPQTLESTTNGTAGRAIDPIALFYLKLFPAPNKPGCTDSNPTPDNSCLSGNYTISPSVTQNSNTFDVRVDHRFNGNNLFFARYDYNKVNTVTPPALGVVNGLQISGGRYNFAGPATDYASQIGLGYTHIFDSRLLVDLRAAYTRINNFSAPLNYGANADTTAGFGPNMNFNLLSNVLTPIAFGPFSDIGDGAYVPLQDIDNTFQYSGIVSYSIGNHQIRAGASFIRRQARNVQSAFPGGQYGFGLASDNVSGGGAKQNDNILASSLVGAFSSESRNYDIDTPDYRTYEPSFFVQDSWKVSPRLTVLYGGRYDLFTPFTEAHGHIANFDYNEARNASASTIGDALKVANVNGVNANAGIKTDYSNFAPRVGFAYSVLPTFVVRGGYGISYFPGNYTSNFDLKNAPFVSVYSPNCQVSTIGLQLDAANLASLNSACSSPGPGGVGLVPGGVNYDGTGTFAAGLPLPVPQTINSGSLSFIAEDPKFRSALIQQYNLQIEQQFGANVLTIGYVGNKGSHLPQTINDINVPLPGNSILDTVKNPNPASSARPLTALLPNLSSVGWGVSEGISNYNALQVSFQRRFSKGLAFDGNYTWGKAMSNNVGFSEEGDQGAYNANPYDTHIDYGVAENSIANRFALSLNYEFQYGKNWTGIRKQALAGWEINSIAVWQSGKPLTIVNGGGLGTDTLPSDVPADGGTTVYGNRATPVNNGGSDRPNIIASPNGSKKLSQYFNVNAFAPQTLGTIGNEVRNSISGPHFRHIDLSLFKDFHLTERYVLQFRAEAYDFTNTPNYYIPQNNPGQLQLGSSNFGRADQNYDPNYTPRQLQFALKLTF
jgi:hypothetical protein